MAEHRELDVAVATKQDVFRLLAGEVEGLPDVYDTRALTQFLLPNDKLADRPLGIGDHIVLVQPDGSLVVLLYAAEGGFLLQSGDLIIPVNELVTLAKPEGDWDLIADADQIDLSVFRDGGPRQPGSSIEIDLPPGVFPLEGLNIGALLDPTEFAFPTFEDDEVAGGSDPDVGITLVRPILLAETDSTVPVLISDFVEIEAGNAAFGEFITEVGLTVSNLPAGTIASAGSISGGTLTFLGDLATFETLTLTFPTDFSTESRIDGVPGDLPAEVFANSNFGAGPVSNFFVRLTPEADLEMAGPGRIDAVESTTDDPLTFLPSDAVLPTATDIDGSEVVTSVALVLNGLPPDADVSFDGGTTFQAVTAPFTFSGSLADYALIVIRVSSDFSTENPASSITGVVTASTNEGGRGVRPFQVEIAATPDIEIIAPADLAAVEDDNGADGSGTTVDLDLDIAVTDADGSEDATVVTIAFGGLPGGSGVNTGVLVGSVWTGTVAQANSLQLSLTGDFSGTVTTNIVAANVEGSESATQTITVTPEGDVDIVVTPLTGAETDATVTLVPSLAWQVSVSDFDPNLPRETLTEVRLTLNDLPAGVTVIAGASGVVVYDPTAGGPLSFVGSAADYAALRLTFPTDFSTESRSDGPAPGPITGTLEATSTEGSNGPVPVSLTITPEGDARIDDTLPDMVPDETDGPTPLTPSTLLLPEATDADGSEAIERLVLVVEGLPNDGTFGLGNLSGVPAGAGTAFAVAGDGSQTLTITLDAAAVGDVVVAYTGISIELPTDFSTANRNDLTTGTTRPIDLELSIQSDEDQNPADDTPVDGTVVGTRRVEIDFELDASLMADANPTGVEDGGPGAGVTISLGIVAAVTDIDGSEDSAVVQIDFTGLPAGARTVDGGGSDTGTLTPGAGTTATWQGTLTEANSLSLVLPANFSGTIDTTVRLLSPEGALQTDQTIDVTPTPDIVFDIDPLVAVETDAPLTIRPSDEWAVTVDDPDGSEMLEEVTLTLTNVPAGVTFTGAGSVSYDVATGGSFTFVGTPDQYAALTLDFPTDFATDTRNDGPTPGPITGTLSATSNEGSAGPAPVQLTIEAEGDAQITDTGATLPDETDGPTLVTPGTLMRPAATDLDGSESISSLVLEVAGVPGDGSFTLADVTLPAGATATLTPGTDGSNTLRIELLAAGVGDVVMAFDALSFEIPADFSTTNRTDLTGGAVARALDLTLAIQTDEDRDLSADTANDGQAVLTRSLEIADTPDVSVSAISLVTAEEDGGVVGPPAPGVTVSLGIDPTVDDADGSETEDPSDPRFAAVVSIDFTGLPPGTRTVDALNNDIGVLTPPTVLGDPASWTGTVAEARALQLALPGDYNGEIIADITVTTPEGDASTSQTIRITPVTDAVIQGAILVDETDLGTDMLEILFSDFVDIFVSSPTERIREIVITLPGLPTGTQAVDDMGVPQGSFTTDAVTGLETFTYSFDDADGDGRDDASGSDPSQLRLIVPGDFSTTSPNAPLSAQIEVRTDDGGTVVPPFSAPPFSAAIPVTITAEGDVRIDGTGPVVADETDLPVTFRLADQFTPMATDADGSESLTSIVVELSGLPAGTRISLNDGTSFTVLPGTDTVQTFASLADYADFIVELPADFSTESPISAPSGRIVATTNEGGVAETTFVITAEAEGDVAVDIVNGGVIDLQENDPPGPPDEDSTSVAPVEFRPSDVLTARGTDADMSETISQVDITIRELPADTLYDLGDGLGFRGIGSGTTLSLSGLSDANYRALTIRVPDDFSTTSRSDVPPDRDIDGTVRFFTNEALIAGETTPSGTNGVIDANFTVRIDDETDVRISTADTTVSEGFVGLENLGLGALVVDEDGSEAINAPITIVFSDLPAGQVVLDDGTGTQTILEGGGNDTWTGDATGLAALSLVSVPAFFSGIIPGQINVPTNEGPAPAVDSFDIIVSPVAEPTIELSVEASEPGTTARPAEPADAWERFSTKEDGSFLLTIDASTPDLDGSERLTEIVINNVPPTWLPDGDITGFFESGGADIATADKSGETITIVLNGVPGVTSFSAGLRVTPDPNDDRDADTIVGTDMVATVSAVDTAPGLPQATADASDGTIVDVDAVVDGLTVDTRGRGSDENVRGTRNTNVQIRRFELEDRDGSEVFDRVEISLSVVSTESDPLDPNDLGLRIRSGSLRGFVDITRSPTDPLDFILTPTPGTSFDEFESAVRQLQVTGAVHVSAVVEVSGEAFWNETTTGDGEFDPLDNFASETFDSTVEIRPIAEATLTASVFVLNAGEVSSGSLLRIEETAVSTVGSTGTSVVAGDTLTLSESTADGSGFGDVRFFVGIDASTP
ncbi:MAG: hypothetical protein AAGK37_14460, partial [Pseudomonadota bacterium]